MDDMEELTEEVRESAEGDPSSSGMVLVLKMCRISSCAVSLVKRRLVSRLLGEEVFVWEEIGGLEGLQFESESSV
jgi:hypothetical protein